MNVTNMVIIAGLILGSLAIISVCWVWVSKQVMGTGGGVLSFFGVMLVGLSIWSRASVEVSPEGVRAEFERLVPLMRSGGFIPSVDHQTPPGVSMEQYRSYLRLLDEYVQLVN